MEHNQFTLNADLIARILSTIMFTLVLASIGMQLLAHLSGHHHILGFVWFFNLDAERNLPTAFSTLLLLSASLLLAIIAWMEKQQNSATVLYWTTLSAGFLLMAGDESLSFHERIGGPLRNLLGGENLGIFHFAWVIPGIILVVALAAFFFKFFFGLSKRTRRAFFLAAAFYLCGAIVMELVGGWFTELYGKKNLTYHLLATIEECFEMVGVIIFIKALVVYLGQNYPLVGLRFESCLGDLAPDTACDPLPEVPIPQPQNAEWNPVWQLNAGSPQGE